MSEKRICPIMTGRESTYFAGMKLDGDFKGINCLKDKCQWWGFCQLGKYSGEIDELFSMIFTKLDREVNPDE
jgi:hypothetical protein